MPGFFTPYRRAGMLRSAGAVLLPTPSAPATPNSPSPASGTLVKTVLSWLSAGQTQADVYLDTVNPPIAIAVPKLAGFSYVPAVELLPNTTYYWKIVAFNAGGSAVGPVWSFATPFATQIFVQIAGSLVSTNILWKSFTVHNILGAQPDTASVTVINVAPVGGNDVRIGIGSLDNDDLVFGGEIQLDTQTYELAPKQGATRWPEQLSDYTYRLNKRRPFGTFVQIPADQVVQALVAVYGPGFTTAGVQVGLPPITISFDGTVEFARIGKHLAQLAVHAEADARNGLLCLDMDVRGHFQDGLQRLDVLLQVGYPGILPGQVLAERLAGLYQCSKV